VVTEFHSVYFARNGRGYANRGGGTERLPLNVINPSQDVLKAFDAQVADLMGQIKNNLFQNVALSHLRDTLLPKLISGELRVPEAEEMMDAL
jgi:hypothetical protein